jgi:long-subunit fatty acid transport protein
VRLGVGYDQTPVPKSTLSPLLPDCNRVLASAGVGVHWSRYDVDLGYLTAFLLKTTSTNPDLIATYDTFGQIISLTLTVKLEHVLQHHRALQQEAEPPPTE